MPPVSKALGPDYVASDALALGDDESIAHRVEAEMTRLLYLSAGFGLFSNFVLGLVLVTGTFPYHPIAKHGLWLGSLLLVSPGRLGINLAFKQAEPSIPINTAAGGRCFSSER